MKELNLGGGKNADYCHYQYYFRYLQRGLCSFIKKIHLIISTVFNAQ